MQHRISGRVLLISGDAILLVKHRDPMTGFEFWVTPGGGLQEPESIYDCARRETYEETGLSVELGDVWYLREFVDAVAGYHGVEFYIMARSHEGTISTSHLIPGDVDFEWVKEAQFVARRDLEELTVFPEELKSRLWNDLEKGMSHPFYLGLQRA